MQDPSGKDLGAAKLRLAKDLFQFQDLEGNDANWGLIEEDILVGRNLKHAIEEHAVIHRPDFLFIALCTRGRVHFKIDGTLLKVSKGSLVVVTPGKMIEIEHLGKDSNGIGFGISREFIYNVIVEYSNLWSLMLQAEKHPHIRLEGKEVKAIVNLHSQLLEASHLPEHPFKTEMIQNLMRAAIYQLAMLVEPHMEINPLRESRDFALYYRFSQLVAQNFRKNRQVAFYAGKLCVSPKYLSAAIKGVSGKTANRWIDEYVTVEARNLLRTSSNTIRQISDYLNFPDASFFTKFFKKNAGMTPKAYREKYGR